MSHDITIREDGTAEVFTGSNTPAWHGLGVTVQGLLTSREAIQAAHLDWRVDLREVFVDGKPLEDYKATVRADNNFPLAVVGKKYSVIQNQDSFEFFDEVVGGGKAIYDTAGSLGGGKRVWIMAKLNGTMFVAGRPDDAIEKMVLLYTTHDGSGALTMQIVATRVVCANTLSIALKGATNKIAIRHTKNYQAKVNEAARALSLCEAYYSDLQGLIDLLESKPMNQGEMVKFTETLIPSREDKIPTRTLNVRAKLVDLFDHGKGNRGRTRFDALNSVTEFVDHHRTTRDTGDGKAENRFESAIFGSGAQLKHRAVDLLVA